MFNLPILRRKDNRPATRRPELRRCCLLVDGLEGRRVLSTITVAPIAEVQGGLIGTNVAAVQNNQITPDCGIIKCGGHLGGIA